VITYEHPLNERVRTLLRLEDLCDRFSHLVKQDDLAAHHSALLVLFDVFEITYRTELKSDLAQELERQRQGLEVWRANPAVSEAVLDQVLREMDQVSTRLLELAGKTGQHVRDNEWLMSIKQRTAIPGGVCEFDLPTYHYWLHQESALRRHDLDQWFAPFTPIRDALSVVLRLLRESGKPAHGVAKQGMFQQMLSGKTAQLLRVRLARDQGCVPEISANKYALNIRFIAFSPNQKPRATENDVEFELQFCSF
jgi:cell division protein ZapD